MKSRLVNVTYIKESEFVETRLVPLETVYLPGEAKPMERGIVCYKGYSAENMHAIARSSKDAQEKDLRSYVYEFEVDKNLDSAYVSTEDVEVADFIEFSRCDIVILERFAQILYEKGISEIDSVYKEVNNEKRLDRSALYDFVVKNPDVLRLVEDDPWFKNKKLYSVAYADKKSAFVLCYILDTSIVSRDKYNTVTTKLKINHMVMLDVPDIK